MSFICKLQLTIAGCRAADRVERTYLRDINRAYRKPPARIVLRIVVDKWFWHGEGRVVQEIERFEIETAISGVPKWQWSSWR